MLLHVVGITEHVISNHSHIYCELIRQFLDVLQTLCSWRQKVSYSEYFPCHEWQKKGCFYCIPQKKNTSNHVQTICCSIPIGNYQTVDIYWLSTCSRENAASKHYTVLCSILPLKMADVPFFVYYIVLNDVATQGL